MVCEPGMVPKSAKVLDSAGRGGREQVRAELPDWWSGMIRSV